MRVHDGMMTDFGYGSDSPIGTQPLGEDFFHCLRHAGIRLWRLIGDDGGMTVGALVQALCEEFEMDWETCLQDFSILFYEMGAGVVAVKCRVPP